MLESSTDPGHWPGRCRRRTEVASEEPLGVRAGQRREGRGGSGGISRAALQHLHLPWWNTCQRLISPQRKLILTSFICVSISEQFGFPGSKDRKKYCSRITQTWCSFCGGRACSLQPTTQEIRTAHAYFMPSAQHGLMCSLWHHCEHTIISSTLSIKKLRQWG